MACVIILDASGALGRHVLCRALAAGHDVTVSARTPSKLLPDVRDRASVNVGDLIRTCRLTWSEGRRR